MQQEEELKEQQILDQQQQQQNKEEDDEDDQGVKLDKCEYQFIENEQIPGLIVIPNFITKEEEQELLDNLEKEDWDNKIKRRTKQFGVYYNQLKKWIERKQFPYPQYLDFLFDRMKENGIMNYPKDQANTLVNEYQPGQVLHPHVDQFGEIVIGINMQADCYMNFINVKTKEEHKIFQKRRHLYIMTKESRYDWKHGILEVNKRRVSITVRSTKPNPKKFPELVVQN